VHTPVTNTLNRILSKPRRPHLAWNLVWALSLFLFLLASPISVWAYVDPGLGTTTITSVLGALSGLVVLFFGAIWYPLRQLVKRVRAFFKE